MKILNTIFLLILLVACNKGQTSENINPPQNVDVIPVNIVDTRDKKNQLNIDELKESLDDNIYYKKLSEETKKKLEKESINITKFVGLMQQAYNGNHDAILTIGSVFQDIKDYENFNKTIELGIKYKVEPFIKLKINKLIEEKKFNKAFELVNKLPKNKENSKIKDSIYFEQASYNLKNKEYKKALKQLDYLYNKGYKELIMQIAYAYLEINDEQNALKHFKKAYKSGYEIAGFEIGAIYFNNKKYDKAMPYLVEQYNLGRKNVAKAIGIIYSELNDVDNAILWLKRAYDEGDTAVKDILSELMSKRGKYNVE